MNPKEILLKLISRIGFSKSILSSSRKHKYYSAVPGEIIASLPKKERDTLQSLTSEDMSKISLDAPIEYFCEEYYNNKDIKDQERSLKEKFDREVLYK